MKIRNGFVSNSSSSSFVCYGAGIDTDESETDEKEKIKNKIIKNIENGFLEVEDKEDAIKKIKEEEDVYELIDILCSFPKLEKNHFAYDFICENHEALIGISLGDVIDDDKYKNITIGEIKKTSKEILTQIFGKETNLSYIEEVWFD